MNINDFSNNAVDINILNHNGYINYVNATIRLNRRTASCIDHWCAKYSNNNAEVKSFVFSSGISDQMAIISQIDL